MAPSTLKELAVAGNIDRFVIEQTADVLARFHKDAVAVASMTDDISSADRNQAKLFSTREQSGCIRKCHGDLTLQNIELSADQQVCFTAPDVETNDAHWDVVRDLSVLLRDLLAHELTAEANILFNRYFDVTGGIADDPATLTALRWYMETSPKAKRITPIMVAVGGLSGSGKSRMSRELAPLFPGAPGARVVRTDVVRKRMMGVGLANRLGSHGYTQDKDQQTYERFCSELSTALTQGHSVIADGVFARQGQRDWVEKMARELAVPFFGLWVDAPQDVRTKRVKDRKNNVSDVTEEIIRQQLGYDLGTINWHQVDSSGPKTETIKMGRDVVGI